MNATPTREAGGTKESLSCHPKADLEVILKSSIQSIENMLTYKSIQNIKQNMSILLTSTPCRRLPAWLSVGGRFCVCVSMLSCFLSEVCVKVSVCAWADDVPQDQCLLGRAWSVVSIMWSCCTDVNVVTRPAILMGAFELLNYISAVRLFYRVKIVFHDELTCRFALIVNVY